MSTHQLPVANIGKLEQTFDFTTTQVAITAASYADIQVPAKALTATLRSPSAWYFSHNSGETGTTHFYVKADEVATIPLSNTAVKHIYAKGSGSQTLYIMYGNSMGVS